MKFPKSRFRRSLNIQSCQSPLQPYISSSHWSIPVTILPESLHHPFSSSTFLSFFPPHLTIIEGVLTQSSSWASGLSFLRGQQAKFVFHYLAGLNGQANSWNIYKMCIHSLSSKIVFSFYFFFNFVSFGKHKRHFHSNIRKHFCNLHLKCMAYTLTGHFIRYTLLVLGWTPFCLQNRLISSWHRFNKVLETFFRYFGPYWDDSITQLLQICQLHIHDENLPKGMDMVSNNTQVGCYV